jgi:hypothetical protein
LPLAQAVLAGALAGLVLCFSLCAASADLHQTLHEPGDLSDNFCAVVLFAGHLIATPDASPPQVERPVASCRQISFPSPVLSSGADRRVAQSRAPPGDFALP